MLSLNPTSKTAPTRFIPPDTSVVPGFLTDMDAPLVKLDEHHALTLRNACEGIQIFGGTGSGKTSGSGRTIAHSFLKAGFGGLVLCAKLDEADNWERYALECGRDKSLIRFSDKTGGRFNFLDYAMLTGKTTQDAVDVLMNVVDVANGQGVDSSASDPIWRQATEHMLSNVIDLLYSAYGTVSLVEVGELAESAPKSIEDGNDINNQTTRFFKETVKRVLTNPVHPISAGDMRAIKNYFKSWRTKHDKYQSSVLATLSTALRIFEKGALREIFTTTSNIVPEMTHAGAIIVVDLPEHEWGDAGIIAQHILKYTWQRAAMRRMPDDNNRPIFLWADESQYFLTSYDATFQSTARSYRASTVYLTQSINAYKEAIGGVNAHDTVMSLLGNLSTHIFHQTRSVDTQNYAADMVGKGLLWRENIGQSDTQGEGINESESDSTSRSRTDTGSNFLFGLIKGMQTGWSENDTYGSTTSRGTSYNTSQTQSRGASQQKDYLLDPIYFKTALRTGGEPCDFVVDGVVIAPNLPCYLHVHFPQGAKP